MIRDPAWASYPRRVDFVMTADVASKKPARLEVLRYIKIPLLLSSLRVGADIGVRYVGQDNLNKIGLFSLADVLAGHLVLADNYSKCFSV